MRLRASQPTKELLHGFRYILCWCSGMNQLISRVYADSLISECSRACYQSLHHDTMSLEQIVNGIGIKHRQQVIGAKGILYLQNLLLRGQHTLAIQQGSDLIKGQAVVLDGQGGMNGTDAVGAMQLRLCRQVTANRDFLDRCGNLGRQRKDRIR